MSSSRRERESVSKPRHSSVECDPIRLLRESLSRSADAIMTLNTAALQEATIEQHALIQELRDRYYTGDGDTVSLVHCEGDHAALAHQLAITSRVLLRSHRTLRALQFLTSGDPACYSPEMHLR